MPTAFYKKLVFPIPTPFPITDPASSAPVPFNLDPPFNIVTAIPDLKLPRTYQWNVSLDQGLGVNQLLTVSYVGAAGRRLLRQEILQNFGNPNFSSLVLTGNGATSDYRALEVQFQRRLSRSFQALASYTWSRSLDNASNNSISTNTPVQQIDPQIDRGASDFDIRHSFSAALTYNLPKPDAGVAGRALLRDWSVDAIVNARSASPVNVTVVRNLGAGIGFIPTRPDLVPGVPIFLNDPNAPGGKRINNTLVSTGPGQPVQIGPFLIPTATRQGALERNSLRGFSLTQLDLALRRRFNLTETVNLQFGAEFFNIFNHPNFADPDSNLGTAIGTFLIPNGFFGQSRSMLGGSLGSGGIFGGLNPLYQVGGPRSIQFSLKLKF